MEIISQAKRETVVRHDLVFVNKGDGSNYSFECSAEGIVNIDNLFPTARENYARVSVSPDFEPPTVRESRWSYKVPAIGRCACGREVELEGFTNTCACGRDYNWAGQELAPRSQWGEETGESVSDILRIK